MAGQQQAQSQYSNRHPKLLITVKRESAERSVTESYAHPRTPRPRNHPGKTVFYNSNYRHSHLLRPTSVSSTSSSWPKHCERYLNDVETKPSTPIEKKVAQPREPQQRGQYRNRKAELDWDHTFDLDQLELYTIQNDSDTRSLLSFTSSSDQSFLSV